MYRKIYINFVNLAQLMQKQAFLIKNTLYLATILPKNKIFKYKSTENSQIFINFKSKFKESTKSYLFLKPTKSKQIYFNIKRM